MKMKTKLLALALCLCFALMSVPVGLSAADPPAGAIAVITGSTHTTPIYLTDPDTFPANVTSNAKNGDTVLLLEDITVKSQVTLPDGVTLDGLQSDGVSRFKIQGDGTQNWGSNHVILFGNDTTLQNVIVDGDGSAIRGTQAWNKNNVWIKNVLIQNVKNHGLKISGSTVAIIGSFDATGYTGFNSCGIDMDPTINNPRFEKEVSVCMVYGTKMSTKTTISTTNASGSDYCYFDARNHVANSGSLIQPNSDEPKCNGTDIPLFEHDNRFHGIMWEKTFSGKKLTAPKREFITYFNVDENGKIIDANGNPTIHPVKEQYVGESHGQSMAATITNPENFSREGYILEGWTTNPDGTGTVYQAGDIIYGNHNKETNDKWDDDLILYAKWKSAVQYTVTWKNYNGTVLETDPVYQGDTPEYNGATPVKTDPTSTEGYHWKFTGWEPEPAPIYSPMTYTAQFVESPPEYTITWRNDDGSLIDTTTVVQGDLPTHAAPTKPDDVNYIYTFETWVPDIVPATCDTTYTAQFTKTPKPPVPAGKEVWKRVDTPVAGKTYLIVAGNNWKAVKNDGGTVAAADVEDKDGDGSLILVDSADVGALKWVAATGWNFKNGGKYLAINIDEEYGGLTTTASLGTSTSVFNWNYANNDLDATVKVGFLGGEDTKYYLTYSGSKFDITKNAGNNIRFYERAYCVQYLDGEERVGSVEFHTEGEQFNLHAAPDDKPGYEFTGWKCNGTTYQAGEPYTMPASDVTFTAQWEPTIYTVTFNPGSAGGTTPTGSDPQPEPGETFTDLQPDTQITLPANTYTADGYVFTGWKCSKDDTKLYQPGDKYTVNANVTFTAQWDIAYTVTFNMNFDESTASQPVPTSIEPVQVAYNGVLTIDNPTRDGYTFNGWGTSPSGPVVYLVTEGADTISYTHNIDKNITLYANWTLLSYTITYNLDGGSNSFNPNKYTVEDPAITLYNPTKAGYTFKGWTVTASPATGNATGGQYPEAGIEAGSTGNVEFTATWETQSFTVTFIIVNGTWNDGGTAEITITVTNGTLDPAQIPTGLIPNAGYQPNPVGWTVDGNPATINTAVGGVTADITYTYTFVPLT